MLDIFDKKRSFSVEYFPPKTDAGFVKLRETARQMAALGPSFQSVTFGTSTQGATPVALNARAIDAVSGFDVDTVCHLTCGGDTKANLQAYTQHQTDNGIRGFLALRGDYEFTNDAQDKYGSVAELIYDIKSRLNTAVGVACYPEPHPKAASAIADLDALKEKQDAGADFAISQFFFDPEIWFDFVDRARAHGITMPLLPGILPVRNIERVAKFAADCGASLPKAYFEAFEASAPEEHDKVTTRLLQEQVAKLIDGGVSHIHIYGFNQFEFAHKAAKAFLADVSGGDMSGESGAAA